jgi:hypothetical protein
MELDAQHLSQSDTGASAVAGDGLSPSAFGHEVSGTGGPRKKNDKSIIRISARGAWWIRGFGGKLRPERGISAFHNRLAAWNFGSKRSAAASQPCRLWCMRLPRCSAPLSICTRRCTRPVRSSSP